MLSPDIRVAHIVEDQRYEMGKPTPYIRIEYYVGTFGPFSLRIPKEQYNELERDNRLEAAASAYRVSSSV